MLKTKEGMQAHEYRIYRKGKPVLTDESEKAIAMRLEELYLADGTGGFLTVSKGWESAPNVPAFLWLATRIRDTE